MLVKLARIFSITSLASFCVVLLCFIASLIPAARSFEQIIVPILLVAFAVCFLSSGLTIVIFRYFRATAGKSSISVFVDLVTFKPVK